MLVIEVSWKAGGSRDGCGKVFAVGAFSDGLCCNEVSTAHRKFQLSPMDPPESTDEPDIHVVPLRKHKKKQK